MITELEQKLHIQYPKIYKNLEEKGMLRVDISGSKIIPSLLYPDDEFWLLSKDDILIETDDLQDDENYLQVNKKYIFIPFAKSGAGDLYCFLFSHVDNDGNIPIVYFWHDDDKANYLTKNLEDFIFMKLLSYLTEEGSSKLLEKNTLDKNMLLESHRNFIKQSYYQILKEKYDLYDFIQVMPLNEYEEVLRHNILFKKFNTAFDYTI